MVLELASILLDVNQVRKQIPIYLFWEDFRIQKVKEHFFPCALDPGRRQIFTSNIAHSPKQSEIRHCNVEGCNSFLKQRLRTLLFKHWVTTLNLLTFPLWGHWQSILNKILLVNGHYKVPLWFTLTLTSCPTMVNANKNEVPGPRLVMTLSSTTTRSSE